MPTPLPSIRRTDMPDHRSGHGATPPPMPPRMSRSQPQLATAYAPGAMFTWEGGKGACIAAPVEGATIDFSARSTRQDQIFDSKIGRATCRERVCQYV